MNQSEQDLLAGYGKQASNNQTPLTNSVETPVVTDTNSVSGNEAAGGDGETVAPAPVNVAVAPAGRRPHGEDSEDDYYEGEGEDAGVNIYPNQPAAVPPVNSPVIPSPSPAPVNKPATPTPPPAPKPVPAPTPVATKYKDGTYRASNDAPWGPMTIDVTVKNDRWTDIKAVQTPDSPPSYYAVPQLIQQALAAQSNNIDGVSGATYTSNAFRDDLTQILTLSKK